MPKTILLVDDNPENRRLIHLVLKRFIPGDPVIQEAEDGAEACAYALSLRPDLILMDIQMPKMDGITAIHEIRKRPETRDIPVIVLSADRSQEETRRAIEAGAADIILKPLDIPAFIASVKSHLP